MESFQELWLKDPVEAVSTFLTIRSVEHMVNPELNSIGRKTKIQFRDNVANLWVIEAYDANNGYDPRLSIGKFSEDEATLDLWDKLHLVNQDKLYHCTADECIFLAFNLLADVERIVSGEYVPEYNPYKAM